GRRPQGAVLPPRARRARGGSGEKNTTTFFIDHLCNDDNRQAAETRGSCTRTDPVALLVVKIQRTNDTNDIQCARTIRYVASALVMQDLACELPRLGYGEALSGEALAGEPSSTPNAALLLGGRPF